MCVLRVQVYRAITAIIIYEGEICLLAVQDLNKEDSCIFLRDMDVVQLI